MNILRLEGSVLKWIPFIVISHIWLGYPGFSLEKDDYSRSQQLSHDLLPWIETYLSLLSDLRETEFDLSMVPKTPPLVAYLAAVLLQVPLMDKQRLLSFENMTDMFADLHRMYRREVALLRNLLKNHIKRADEFFIPIELTGLISVNIFLLYVGKQAGMRSSAN